MPGTVLLAILVPATDAEHSASDITSQSLEFCREWREDPVLPLRECVGLTAELSVDLSRALTDWLLPRGFPKSAIVVVSIRLEVSLFQVGCFHQITNALLSSPVTDYKASVALLHNETEIVKKQHVIMKIPLRWILNAQFIN